MRQVKTSYRLGMSMNNSGLELTIDERGNLVLDGTDIPTNIDESELAFINNLAYHSALWELLETYLCNGWKIIEVALFSGDVLESPDGILYANTFYDTRNAVQELIEGKKYIFYKVEKDDN